jgi:16S rRNA (cytosine967-C5)-methyltransferase
LRKIDRKSDQNAYYSEEHGHNERSERNDLANSHPFAKNAKSMGQSAYISAHPPWLIQRWERTYGADAAAKICEYDQSMPESVIRIQSSHPSKTAKGGAASNVFTDSPELRLLNTDGIQLEPGNLLSTAFTVTAGDISQSTAFRKRRVAIQDEASQLVALLVGNGNQILDCCAAPGGKTRILAERNPAAIVIAMELHPRRAALLKKLVTATNVHIVAADVRSIPTNERYDRVLVDAPCSGTGTLARNPEIKWRLKAEDLSRLQSYQVEILSTAMQQVKTGGRIIYSTCSLEPEENEQVIEKVLNENSGFRLVDVHSRVHELKASGELAWKDIDSLITGP